MTRPLVRLPRSLLSGAFFVAWGLFALPLAVVIPCLPKRAGRGLVRFFYRLFVLLARLTGLFAVAPGAGSAVPRGKIVVMNHVSLIDVCVLLARIPDSACVVKAAAKRNPFLSAVARKLFIFNDSGWEKTVADAGRLLGQGVNVVIFPQGTRGGDTLHRGAARLALATGTDVVPFSILYDPVVLAKGQPWWDVGDKVIRISLEQRASIVPTGANDRAGAVALTARIAEAIGVSCPDRTAPRNPAPDLV
ncbi:MAG: 1-acyl-sn-glycerol-3-phosphate acyltransferase [Kiritimatiellae bacterium]|nr:1-acyl-sn-glycerol-3-phosphate acyltransferase [Kiritimatiellia bacterium]